MKHVSVSEVLFKVLSPRLSYWVPTYLTVPIYEQKDLGGGRDGLSLIPYSCQPLNGVFFNMPIVDRAPMKLIC